MVSARPGPAPGRGKAAQWLRWLQSHRTPGTCLVRSLGSGLLGASSITRSLEKEQAVPLKWDYRWGQDQEGGGVSPER